MVTKKPTTGLASRENKIHLAGKKKKMKKTRHKVEITST